MPEITIFGMKISIDTRLGRINCCGENCTYTPSDRLDIRLIIDTFGIELFADNGLIYIVGGAKKILADFKPKVLFATCGSDGAFALTDSCTMHFPCYNSVKAVDTTGAGDCFCGAALSKLLDIGLSALTKDALAETLRFVSAAAGLVTEKIRSAHLHAVRKRDMRACGFVLPISFIYLEYIDFYIFFGLLLQNIRDLLKKC